MSNFNDWINKITTTTDTTSMYTEDDIKDSKAICVLCYFGILFFIPILVKRNSPYVKFHTNQGLVLFLAAAINTYVIGNLLAALPAIGILFSVISSLLSIFLFVLAVLGIINTLNGRARELPVFGSIKIIK